MEWKWVSLGILLWWYLSMYVNTIMDIKNANPFSGGGRFSFNQMRKPNLYALNPFSHKGAGCSYPILIGITLYLFLN